MDVHKCVSKTLMAFGENKINNRDMAKVEMDVREILQMVWKIANGMMVLGLVSWKDRTMHSIHN